MTGNENIKAGDELLCLQNVGLYSMGDKRLIWGINETSINLNGSYTGWEGIKQDWYKYQHLPCEAVPQKVIDFNYHVENVIRPNNKILLEKRRKELSK